MSGNINDKIRKLMALADHPGTGPEESAAAAGMAAALALKYNIDLAAAHAADQAEAQAKNFTRGDAAVTAPGGNRAALMHLASGVAALYGCRFVVWQDQTSKCGFSFVGQPHNVAMAGTWLKYLWEACKRADTAHRRGRVFAVKGDEYRASMSFRLYFSAEVNRRLADKLASMRRGDDTGGAGTALMVVNWFEQERKEVAAWMAENMKLKAAKTAKKRALDSTAASAGHEQGKRASLNDQIGATTRPAQAQIR
jgi:nucleotide-binding universal stress UspA family protein